MIRNFFWLSLVVCTCLSCQTQENSNAISYDTSNALFQLQNPQATGVDFVNQVEDQDSFNILSYRNFYNGGGVAIGDLNNDGLQDIYFTSNLESNRLYLNRGDWQFEEVTDSAKVGGARSWSTGVSLVDINADGWLDIYVCNSGDIQGESKENELFINQKDGTFWEEAAKWGLNNPGFSTHASFFDYDGDGDLDCYVLNNSFRSPNRVELYQKTREEVDEEGGDRLYRNEGDHFVDVTQEAGIYSSDIGFGLGVSVSDLNQDMLPDIYVANDFWERDYLYINQGDGTFSEELTQRTDRISLSSMGADLADLNNDGFPEVVCTEMLPGDNMRLKTMAQFNPVHIENRKFLASYHHQYMQNSLQVNDGMGYFTEQANLSGIAATDWSWGALAFDFQLDGLKDLFISNGIQRDITNLDIVDFSSSSEGANKIVEGTIDQLINLFPSSPMPNYAFVNQGGLGFTNLADSLGLATASFSNGSAYGDLDNDQDLDLVVNNANMPAFLYQNRSNEQVGNHYLSITLKGLQQNPLGIGAKVQIYASGKMQEQQHFTTRGFQSSVAPGLVFGLGKRNLVDSIRVIWPDKKVQVIPNIPADEVLELDYKDAGSSTSTPTQEIPALFSEVTDLVPPQAIHVENTFNDFDHERLLPRGLSTEGPKIVRGDVNGDDLEDFILLGATDDPHKLFLQTGSGKFQYKQVSAFEADKAFEGTCGLIWDRDGDGDNDLMVGHGGNEFNKGFASYALRYYENDGQGNFFPRPELAPKGGGNFSVIRAADVDEDGDLDLFVGGRVVPGNYGLIPTSYLLIDEGPLGWRDGTTQAIGTLGMVTDALWDDVNGDARPDLVVVGEWMPVTIFYNTGNDLEKQEVAQTRGWWTSIAKADLDGDQQTDYILGNWGLNTKFQASGEKPLSLYVKDFDNNGKSEFILNWYPPLEKQAYPFPTKMELTEQLPHLKKKILKYAEYGGITYESLFSPEEQQGALKFTTEQLASSVLFKGNNGWRLEALPRPAQVSAVYGICTEDFNQDGHLDIFLGGNLYDLKPEVGRADGNRGLVLLGDGKGNWDALSPEESGMRITGEVRDVQVMTLANGEKVLLVARNNEKMLGWQW